MNISILNAVLRINQLNEYLKSHPLEKAIISAIIVLLMKRIREENTNEDNNLNECADLMQAFGA